MGFFGKIKQMLGVGTISVKLKASEQFKTSDTEIKGTVTITAKSDQLIESIEMDFKEEFTTGSGDNEKTKEFMLGKSKLPGFPLKAGESKTIEFTLPFEYTKSAMESLGDKGGVMGGIGKIGAFAKGEKSVFWLTATANTKGVKVPKLDTMELKKAKS